MHPYTVVFSPSIHQAYQRLPHDEHVRLDSHLIALAEAAGAAQDTNDGERALNRLAGVAAGSHRGLLDNLWLSYRIDPHQQVLRLLDLGDARLTSRMSPPLSPTAWRPEEAGEDAWSNEGGANHPSESALNVHTSKEVL